MTLRSPLACRLLAGAVLCLPVATALAAQDDPVSGIRVRAACFETMAQSRRVLTDLSCESAMQCWSDTDRMRVRPAEAAQGDGDWAASGLVYVDEAGRVLEEPPMQGTIRAVWDLSLPEAAAPARLRLFDGDSPVTAAFEPVAGCSALPEAAVKRLLGR